MVAASQLDWVRSCQIGVHPNDFAVECRVCLRVHTSGRLSTPMPCGHVLAQGNTTGGGEGREGKQMILRWNSVRHWRAVDELEARTKRGFVFLRPLRNLVCFGNEPKLFESALEFRVL